jgi:DNA-binding transcriptional ArsR family regulator
MAASEEETYSIIFTTLKHPARRKILRMLAEKPKNFSHMLEELGISSSHLTYHIENLGELVTKMDDGRYRLSSFGKAAVATMKGVEETPDIRPTHQLALSWHWKTFFGALMVCIVVLSVLSAFQYLSLSDLTSEHEELVADFNQLSEDYDRVQSWGVSTDRVVRFLEDVIQLDLTKYHARLERNTVEYRSELGGITEEVLTYTLTGEDSELGIDFRFRNQTLSRYRMDIIEGTPFFAHQQPNNVIDKTEDLLQRYQTYAGVSYMEPMIDMLEAVNEAQDIEKTEDYLKLVVSTDGQDSEIKWMLTTSGILYQAKELTLKFDDGILEMLTDGWFLFSVGNTDLNVSHDQAIAIALENIEGFSWTEEGITVTNYTIIETEAEAELWPHLRDNTLELFPYWYVTMPLDKTYPGNINYIAIGVWGDTGEITTYTPRN